MTPFTCTKSSLSLLWEKFTEDQVVAFKYYYGCDDLTVTMDYPYTGRSSVTVQYLYYDTATEDAAIDFTKIWFKKWTDGNLYAYDHRQNLLLKAVQFGSNGNSK